MSLELIDIEDDWRNADLLNEYESLGLVLEGDNLQRLCEYVQTLPTRLQERAYGCYIFVNESGVPLYVGKSSQLRTRLLTHLREKDNNTQFYIRFTRKVVIIRTSSNFSELEYHLISTLKPMFNGPAGGEATIGGYISFYKKRKECKGISLSQFNKLVSEWKENSSDQEAQRKWLTDKTKEDAQKINQGGSALLNINISDIKQFMEQEKFDLFVLNQLKVSLFEILPEIDRDIIFESLGRTIEKVS